MKYYTIDLDGETSDDSSNQDSNNIKKTRYYQELTNKTEGTGENPVSSVKFTDSHYEAFKGKMLEEFDISFKGNLSQQEKIKSAKQNLDSFPLQAESKEQLKQLFTVSIFDKSILDTLELKYSNLDPYNMNNMYLFCNKDTGEFAVSYYHYIIDKSIAEFCSFCKAYMVMIDADSFIKLQQYYIDKRFIPFNNGQSIIYIDPNINDSSYFVIDSGSVDKYKEYLNTSETKKTIKLSSTTEPVNSLNEEEMELLDSGLPIDSIIKSRSNVVDTSKLDFVVPSFKNLKLVTAYDLGTLSFNKAYQKDVQNYLIQGEYRERILSIPDLKMHTQLNLMRLREYITNQKNNRK